MGKSALKTSNSWIEMTSIFQIYFLNKISRFPRDARILDTVFAKWKLLPLNSIGDDDGKKSRPLHPPHFGTGFLEDNSRSNHFLDDLSTFVKMKVKVFRVFQTIF